MHSIVAEVYMHNFEWNNIGGFFKTTYGTETIYWKHALISILNI